MSQVFNFGAGPAMLPRAVMEKAQKDFLNYNNLGAGLIEISHRSSEFEEVLSDCDSLLKELATIPDNYKILYMHGGAQMQFSAVPLNLLNLSSSKTASYIETGTWGVKARKECSLFGRSLTFASGAKSGFTEIPKIDPAALEPESAYVHITSNNTLYGTRWTAFPDFGDIPLVADMTSEFLSRKIDISKFGLIFAGLQKNLGPAGLAVVIVREDLVGSALQQTPALLDYKTCIDSHSLANTTNTFALYMMSLVLKWLKQEGGVDVIEARNELKAKIIYEVIDASNLYTGVSRPKDRSMMNVTFNFQNQDLLAPFINQAESSGLYALKGHRDVGGARASIYNAMPIEGCEALAQFMLDFEKKNS